MEFPQENKEGLTEAQVRQQERRERYAEAAAERVRSAEDCQFSLLPAAELTRAAALWYDACAEGMMRANFGPMDTLIRQEARIAAEQNFEFSDLLQLLRIFRQTALEKEGWHEDQLADTDQVINEALSALRDQVSWQVPAELDYLTGKSEAIERAQAEAAAKAGELERRGHGRNKLHLPIRLRGFLAGSPLNEITRTENVAKGGVQFLSDLPYHVGARLDVAYPYWETRGAINEEYAAEVVRIEKEEAGARIALRFLEPLGGPKRRS